MEQRCTQTLYKFRYICGIHSAIQQHCLRLLCMFFTVPSVLYMLLSLRSKVGSTPSTHLNFSNQFSEKISTRALASSLPGQPKLFQVQQHILRIRINPKRASAMQLLFPVSA